MEILHRIYGWFEGSHLKADEILQVKGNVDGRIFWLDGIAGTGKSTIAETVARHFDGTNELGASFFCSRDSAECSNVNLIFPTIAYQLSSFSPAFKKRVSAAMRKDPDLQYSFSSRQLKKLVVEPLHGVMHEEGLRFRPCIIIIDALDECKDSNAISTILFALSESTDDLSPLRFFITSRPVPNIVQGFRNAVLMKETGRLILHNIPFNISEKDIRIYLEAQLSDIARSFSLPSSWPPNEDVVKLVKKSAGLFIFAATASKFIADWDVHNPKRQLTILTSATYVASGKASPHRELDLLYLQVLHEAFPDISGDQRAWLKMVLGTAVLLFDPLDPEGLEALLGLDESTARMTLCSLHSLIIVPEVEDGPVRLIHPSVHDFLVDDS